MLRLGMIYIGAVFTVYFIAGLGLIAFLSNIPLLYAQFIAIIVGGVVVLAGIVEIKDFFWYGQGMTLAISPKHAKKIKDMAQNMSVGTVISLGVFVAAVELPCTGGPYLAITLSSLRTSTLPHSCYWFSTTLFSVMPLVVILLLVVSGKKIHDIKQWKGKWKSFMRLGTGIILIWLGWLLIMIANGSINMN